MSNIQEINMDLISRLKKLEGAINYDGSCSEQVVFILKNGKTLRIGITEDDCTDTPGKIWCDQYEGLNDELKPLL